MGGLAAAIATGAPSAAKATELNTDAAKVRDAFVELEKQKAETPHIIPGTDLTYRIADGSSLAEPNSVKKPEIKASVHHNSQSVHTNSQSLYTIEEQLENAKRDAKHHKKTGRIFDL